MPFRGNLYGTSLDGIRELMESGLQPVLTPHYQVREASYISLAGVHFCLTIIHSRRR